LIFRRLATAFRRQDWYAVVIEFLLVVAGVLVALQLDTWAQRQADAQAYEAAIERLRGEVAANLETIGFVEEEVATELPKVRGALDALETCADDPQTLGAVNEGLAFITGTSGLSLRNSALEELTVTPRLLSLQSPAMRRRLADLLFYLEVVEGEARFYELTPLEAHAERIPILSPGPWKQKQTSYLGIDFTGDRRALQLNVPVSVACQNTDLVAALWVWVRYQSVLPVLTNKMREEFDRTIELLNRDAEGKGNPR
jgi:hypothetical protein